MAVQTKMLLQRIHQAPAVAFEETIAIYRDAVAFLMEAMDASIPDLSVYDGKSIKNAMNDGQQNQKTTQPGLSDFNRRFHKSRPTCAGQPSHPPSESSGATGRTTTTRTKHANRRLWTARSSIRSTSQTI